MFSNNYKVFLRINYLFDIHRTEEHIQVLKLGVFLGGDLVQPSKSVGIDGFLVSQVEWFILGGKGFL